MINFPNDIIKYFENRLNSSKGDYLALFCEIQKKFSKKDFIKCLNHILAEKTDIKLLNLTIREINKNKYFDNFSCLIDFIIKPYGEKYADLKVLAIKTLGNYKNKKALNALLFCLNDKKSSYKIRFAAAEALGNIGDQNAFDSLEKVATDEEEKSTYVKESAVVALGMLGDKRALDVFNSILNTKQMFQEKFSYLKESVLEAISKFDISKDKKAYEIIKKTLLDPSANVRIAAIEALMNSNLKENKDLIYDRLKFDSDLEVKKNALVALYNLNYEGILKEVIEGDFEEELKTYAKEILEEYGEEGNGDD